jgi:hypothetical protein
MNAFRKTSLLVLLGFVAAISLGSATTAEAGGCHHGYGIHSSYRLHGSYGLHHVSYPSYANYGTYTSCYGPSSYWPTHRVATPVSYPVTLYDSYGRPYVVLQTGYSYLP